MYLIIGLGNPGKRYGPTRHNIGWKVVEKAASRWSVKLVPGLAARVGEARLDEEVVTLALPRTWMNLAGGVVQELVEKLQVNLNQLIVVHDDLDLEAGLIRVKRRGGSGGHNGIRSIVTALGTGEFIRLKVGIGRPLVGQEAADFVLSPFLPSETSDIEAAVTQAVDAAECLVTQGPVVAMNRFNKRNKEVDEL